MKKFTLFLMSLCVLAMVACASAKGNALGNEMKDILTSSISGVSSADSQDAYMEVVTNFQTKWGEINAKVLATPDERLSADLEAEIEKLLGDYEKACQTKAAELGIL
ncbi:MAG: hypothetical protein R3Y19_02220 [Rikenellaceae bacterium]